MKEEKGVSFNIVSKTDLKPLIQKQIVEPTQNNIQIKSKYNILLVLISIYNYEKNILNGNKGINFNQREKYYLIKSSWINELKKYYDYQKISKSLDKLSTLNKSNNSININNISNNYQLEKIESYLNKNNVNLLSKQLNANLKGPCIKKSYTKSINNFIYYSNGYIINSEILKIFEQNIFEGQKTKLNPISIFSKENNIFLPLFENNIFVTIGNLNNNFEFHGISCLCYRNSDIFENEKNELLNKSFEDYIISRQCQENDLKVQNLKKELSIIGQYQKINLSHLNFNILSNKRAISSKPRTRKFDQEEPIMRTTRNQKKNNQILYNGERNSTKEYKENQEQIKIDELEKEVSRLKNKLNYQSEKIKNLINDNNELKELELNKDNKIKDLENKLNYQSEKIKDLINDNNELKELELNKDYQIKDLKYILAYILKENSELKRDNEILQAQISQKKGNINEEQNSLKYYEEPTLIRLNNLGASCFMNSALQCLSQIASLSNYFLKDSTYKMIIENNID